jgi:hypothetical protein
LSQASARPAARVLARRYELQERIGAGGAGAVWRAHDRTLDRIVAVKLLRTDVAEDAEAAARFRAEASAAAKLTHPNAVIVYDIGHDDGDDYIVMEHVDGATLGALLPAGPLPPGLAAAVGTQVGRALGTAHARGLVHRDVKPANVLVTTDGVVKVADFGIARALGDGSSRLTTTGAVMGTARYLAPEQLRDEPVDARADVYALGLVLHQCLTGSVPYGQGSAVEVAMRRLTTQLPDLRTIAEVPDALAAAVTRATALDPGDRFEDGAAFAAALAPLASGDAGNGLARRVAALPAAGATPPRETSPNAPSEADLTPPSSATRRLEVGPGRPSADTGAVSATTAATTTAAVGAGRTSQPSQPAAPARTEEPTGRGRAAAPGRDTRGRGLAIVSVVVFLAVLLAVGYQLLGDEGPGIDLPATGETDAPDQEPPASDGETVPIVASGDHDPGGSGEEHPDRVAEAHDGDPSTYWRTQRYRNDPALGGLKDGVGIWLTVEEPGPIGSVTILSEDPGADLTVFVGTGAPGSGVAPEEWGTEAASVSDADAEETLTFDAIDGDTVLVWLTRLPPDGDRFRGTVAEVSVARP